jgi:hypothetical protein
METMSARTGTPLQDVPRKPLDNPPKPKPSLATDEECACMLASVLGLVPSELRADCHAEFPLLDKLAELDASQGADLARQLLFIAAMTHRTADERRTAEYLLRHRRELIDGRRSAVRLLRSARNAAVTDLRRAQQRERPVSPAKAALWSAAKTASRANDPSVGEMVLDKLWAATGLAPTTARCRTVMLDAVSVALAVAERHVKNPRRREPSLIAMRADARPQARLVTRLRAEMPDLGVTSEIARLLVGGDRTPIDSALLWWSARPDLAQDDVPEDVLERWARDFKAIDEALSAPEEINSPDLPGVSS